LVALRRVQDYGLGDGLGCGCYHFARLRLLRHSGLNQVNVRRLDNRLLLSGSLPVLPQVLRRVASAADSLLRLRRGEFSLLLRRHRNHILRARAWQA
jgi:hypothetical protein